MAFAFIPLETYFPLLNFYVRKTSKCGLLPGSMFHLWNFDSSGIGVVVKFEAGICYDSQVPFHVHATFIFYFLLLMASLLISSFAFPPLPFSSLPSSSAPPSFSFPFSDGVCSNAWAGLEILRTVGTAGCTPHMARHALFIATVTVLRGGILKMIWPEGLCPHGWIVVTQFLNKIPLCACLPVDGHLGRFCFLATVNRAAMSMDVKYLCVSLSYVPMNHVAGSYD